jgi:hypothetical protein
MKTNLVKIIRYCGSEETLAKDNQLFISLNTALKGGDT